MREVLPDGGVGRRAVCAAGGESDVDGVEAHGHVDGPAKKHVGYDTKRRPAMFSDGFEDEVPARSFEAP